MEVLRSKTRGDVCPDSNALLSGSGGKTSCSRRINPTATASAGSSTRTTYADDRGAVPTVSSRLTLPTSNGLVEGKVNKLKLIKRMGYGRAGFPLLRQRVLHAL